MRLETRRNLLSHGRRQQSCNQDVLVCRIPNGGRRACSRSSRSHVVHKSRWYYWDLKAENISSIERLVYTLKLRKNRHLPFSVKGLLFIGDFSYHKAHILSANGR